MGSFICDERFLVLAQCLNDSFETNRRKLLRSSHSRFLICKDGLGEVVGVLRAKSVLDASLEGKPFDFASEAVKPLYVPETLTMIELLEAFKKHRQHLGLVVDEYGEIQGLVTMNNVLEILVEDVVGEPSATLTANSFMVFLHWAGQYLRHFYRP